MMERVTTIRADQWELVAEDVKAGRCEVLDFDDDIVIKITPRNYGFNVFNINSNGDSWISDSYSTFTVRWLDTAQTERDAEAGDAPSVNVFAAYVGELEAKVASLQAERDELQARLAAAVRFRNYTAVWHKPDGSKVLCPVTYMSNADWVQEFELFAESVTTPQPAPAPTGELVAAVKQFTFMTALRRLENGMDTLQVSSQFANSEWIEAFQHMHKCMEDAVAK